MPDETTGPTEPAVEDPTAPGAASDPEPPIVTPADPLPPDTGAGDTGALEDAGIANPPPDPEPAPEPPAPTP